MRNLEGIPAEGLLNSDSDRRTTIEAKRIVIVHGTPGNATHVAKPNEPPLRTDLHDDVREGGDVMEAARAPDTILIVLMPICRSAAERTGDHLDVLAANRGEDVVDR
jgi:hypothetical protein